MCSQIFLIILLASFLAPDLGVSANGFYPDHTNHAVSYEDEYEAFENDLIASIPETKSRAKRFIYMNTDTFVAVALLVGVPLSIVLPSLGNIFNKWRRRRSTGESDAYPFTEDDPAVQPKLDRISTYFNLVDIPEHSCQLRAICEFSANPDKYYPLSEMILSRIRNPNLPSMIYLENSPLPLRIVDNTTTPKSGNGSDSSSSNQPAPKSLFKIYNGAANLGSEYGYNRCETNFGSDCHYSMDKLLNMPTLRFWTAMQRFLKLKFTDGNLSF